MKKYILLIIVTVFIVSCQKENKTKQIGERFFETYAERKDVQKMLSFYADEFQYENVGFEMTLNDSKYLYENVYGWSDPNFIFSGKQTITVDETLSSDSTIVAKGITMPYTYNGKNVEGTRFVIWLELDKDLKIRKQTDWFDYPMAELIEAYRLKNSMKIE